MTQSESLASRLVTVLDPLEDVSVRAAPTRGNFWDRVKEDPADLILIQRSVLPVPASEAIESIRSLTDEPDVIVIWDEEDPEERARLLIAGCSAVLYSGLSDDILRETVGTLVERHREVSVDRLHRELTEPEHRLADFDSASPAMRNFMRMVKRVVEPDSSLLILGETGVGKERLARAIHAESPRGSEPFIPVNCAAFPETLLEGELFGYEEGAFTGAVGDRRGYFELAHGGTIFLDEIGEMPRHLQVTLLRVLQERTIQPLGSEKEIEIDVRVMAATNRDLEDEIKTRRFRRDLYYRLSVVTLEIPSLRDRREDIPPLLHRYLAEFSVRMGRAVTEFSPEAVEALVSYSWPGNVRELINVVERALILVDGDTITLNELPPGMGRSFAAADLSVSLVPQVASLSDDWHEKTWDQVKGEVLSLIEGEYLVRHLTACRGKLADTSETTGIKPRSLYQSMKRHGLKKEDFRKPRG
tara:strand:- start:14820 stop:16235 length:1416 start_codon:yes stop_codon:yes gene_type:complete